MDPLEREQRKELREQRREQRKKWRESFLRQRQNILKDDPMLIEERIKQSSFLDFSNDLENIQTEFDDKLIKNILNKREQRMYERLLSQFQNKGLGPFRRKRFKDICDKLKKSQDETLLSSEEKKLPNDTSTTETTLPNDSTSPDE